MASFTWTLLCPPGSLWMSKQHVLPCPEPCAVCVPLWSDSLVGYIISAYWMFLPPSHSIFYVLIEQETCGTWQEAYPAFCCFCVISALACMFSHRVSSCSWLSAHERTHVRARSYSSDNCRSSPALRSWTGLTTSVCINTLLSPLGWLLFIAAIFTRT